MTALPQDQKTRAGRLVGSWALFDFANSVLITNGGLYFSQWLVIDNRIPNSWFNVALSVTSTLVLATAPLIGNVEDRRKRWLQVLWLTTILMSICSIAMAFAPRLFANVIGVVLLNLAFFCVINYCYELSSMYYDSLLPRVVKGAAYGRVSGLGFAAGWIGAIVGLVAVYPFAQGSVRLFSNPTRIDSFIPAAILYFVLTGVSLIGLSPLRTRPNRIEPASTAATTNRLNLRFLTKALKQKNILAFLGVYFFMSGSVLTVQANMPLYLEVVMGFPDSTKVALISGFLVVAALGALVTGYSSDRFGYKNTLAIVVAGWVIMLTLLASTTNRCVFFVIFGALAILFGSIWTLTRAIFSKLAPPEERVAYFGIYTAVERLASIAMPAIWAGVMVVVVRQVDAIRYRVAVAVMAFFALFAFSLLRRLELSKIWKETT